MSNLTIQPELIRWARERAGLPVEALVERFPRFEQWEQGESQPTMRQLETLAKVTHAPLGYFFLKEPPLEKLTIPDFRTVGDEPVRRPSPDLLETLQTLELRQAWMRDYMSENSQPALDFVGSAKLSDDPVVVAVRMRKQLSIKSNWASIHNTWTDALRALRDRIESIGILVTVNGVVGNNNRRKLDPQEFRGFVLCDRYAPFLFINGADAKSAQMFTLAHELAHVWLGSDGLFNLPNMQPSTARIERFCNRIAAEFLIPKDEMNGAWSDFKGGQDPFRNVGLRFKVSPIVAARRALDLSLISEVRFFQFYREYQSKEIVKSADQPSGGNFYVTQNVRLGKRFAHAIIGATKEGRLSFREAYQLTGLHGATFERFAKKLDG